MPAINPFRTGQNFARGKRGVTAMTVALAVAVFAVPDLPCQAADGAERPRLAWADLPALKQLERADVLAVPSVLRRNGPRPTTQLV